jgi:hypothetical protein
MRQSLFYVMRCGYFYSYRQPYFLLHALQPWQGGFAHAFKRARPGAGLPDSGPEQINIAQGLQAAGRGQYQFFGFGAAGTGN